MGSLSRTPYQVRHFCAFVQCSVSTAFCFVLGLISRAFQSHEELMDAALTLGKTIAEKSPVAAQSSKIHLNYSRDHSVEEGLQFAVLSNSTFSSKEETILKA